MATAITNIVLNEQRPRLEVQQRPGHPLRRRRVARWDILYQRYSITAGMLGHPVPTLFDHCENPSKSFDINRGLLLSGDGVGRQIVSQYLNAMRDLDDGLKSIGEREIREAIVALKASGDVVRVLNEVQVTIGARLAERAKSPMKILKTSTQRAAMSEPVMTALAPLNVYRTNYSSRDGEDGIVAYLVERYDVPATCVEVGASDGRTQSNTLRLREELRWEAVLIEPPGPKFEKLKRLKNERTHLHSRFIEVAGPNSLDALVGQHFTRIGVLSLDIDGNELEIFENLQMRPAIVVIEYNRSFPIFIDYQDPPGHAFFRHSAKAVARVAKAKGYRTVAVTKDNVILLDEALIDSEERRRLVPDLPVEALFDQAKDGRIALWISSKRTSTRFAFTNKPGAALRMAGVALTAHALVKQALRGKWHLKFSPSEPVRGSLERAGIFL